MGFLDSLAPFLDTAASGMVAHETGKRERAEADKADALAQLEQRARQAALERQARMDALNTRNIESQIADREATERRLSLVKPPERNIDPLSSEGRQARLALETDLAKVRPQNATGGTFTQFTDPNGNPVFFNPTTRQSVQAPAGFTPPSPRTGLPTEAERKAAGLLLTGENGYKNLQRLLGQPDDNPATPEREDEAAGKAAPGFFNRQLSRMGMGIGNIISPDDLRQIDQAAYDLTEAWLRLTSGAAISAQEITDQAKAIIPQPGDDDATRSQKARSRRLRVEAIRNAAGRAANPNAQGTADPSTDLDSAINAVLGRQP